MVTSRLANRLAAALRGVPPPQPPALAMAERPGRLVTVTGQMDGPGIEQLAARLAAVLTEGTAFLGLDLSRVSECGTGLFAVLARTHDQMREREGWLRLVGLSPAVLDALDHASIEEILAVYLTSDCTPGSGGGADDTLPANA